MNESQILPNINLSVHQKMLLAQIHDAPESPDGGKRISFEDEKMVTAKKILLKLGIITVDSQHELFTLTDRATTLMQETGIIDESGELTEDGVKLAAGETPIEQPDTPTTNETFSLSFKQYLILVE